MLPDVYQAERPWILDEHAEDPAPTRELSDGLMGCRIDAGREEALELCALLIQDAESGEFGVGDSARGLENPVEHRLGIKLAYQRLAYIK
jgi:hypothetical protein